MRSGLRSGIPWVGIEIKEQRERGNYRKITNGGQRMRRDNMET